MKVAIGTLKDKGDDLVAFLEPRVGTKPGLSGETLEIDDDSVRKGVKPRDVKTYIKRFLYMNSLRKNYRILVEGKELTVQELELGEEEEEKKKETAEKIEKAEEGEEEVRESTDLKEAESKEKEVKAEEKKEKEAEEKKGEVKAKGEKKAKAKEPKGKKEKPPAKKKAKTKTKED